MTQTHGIVFRRNDGTRASCGGPGLCPECSTDLARFAATDDPGPIVGRFRTALEVELQATFTRARGA